MSVEPFLAVEDFPIAQVGNLILSPRRVEPIAVATSEMIARQIAVALNRMAQDERAGIDMTAWLIVH